LHLVGCLHGCATDARSHKRQVHIQYMLRGKSIVLRWNTFLISQTLLNPVYEYVAVAVKIRVEHIAFRTVRDKTAHTLFHMKLLPFYRNT